MMRVLHWLVRLVCMLSLIVVAFTQKARDLPTTVSEMTAVLNPDIDNVDATSIINVLHIPSVAGGRSSYDLYRVRKCSLVWHRDNK